MNFNDQQLLNLKFKFLQLFKENKINEAQDVAKLMLQIDPKNRIALKCDHFITINKQQLMNQEQYQESDDENQQEEQEDNSDESDSDQIECEDVIEPMWDEQEYQKQKQKFLEEYSKSKDIKEAIKKAQN